MKMHPRYEPSIRAAHSPALLALALAGLGCGGDENPAGGTTGAGEAPLGTETAPGTTPGPGDDSGQAETSGVGSGSDGATSESSSADTTGQGGDTGAGPFEPNPLFDDLGDESSLDLGQFMCPPVPGEDKSTCRGMTDYSGITYDPNHHRMLAYGGGHSTTMIDSIVALELTGPPAWSDLFAPTACGLMVASNLDETLGVWLEGDSGPYPRPISAHTYDLIAVAPQQDEFVVLGRMFTQGYCNNLGNSLGGPIAHFDFGDPAWTFAEVDSGSGEFQSGISSGEYDPIADQFVSLGSDGLALYDPATRQTTIVGGGLGSVSGNAVNVSDLGYANHLTYYPPSDTFYYFLRGAPVQTVALTLDRRNPAQSTLDWVETTGPTSPHGEPGYAYDARNEIVGGAVADGTFYSFHPEQSLWTSHPVPGGPGSQAFHALAYDPVNNVHIFVTGYEAGFKTWAYRLAN